MPLRDCLLQIDSYPEPSPSLAIDQAVAFCRTIDARVSALAVGVTYRTPSNWLAEQTLQVSKLAETEKQKSLQACQAALRTFADCLKSHDMEGDSLIVQADVNAVGDAVAAHARTRDLCIVPVQDKSDGQRSVAEDVIFGSGRPTLVFKPGPAGLPTSALGDVLVAWDGSRCAARALGDAIPVLQKASKVRLMTIINEKRATLPGSYRGALRHLKAHGIRAEVEEVDAAGRRIGEVLDAIIQQKAPDLIVMGAYGRPKLREIILGGATEHLLSSMRAPLFLAH